MQITTIRFIFKIKFKGGHTDPGPPTIPPTGPQPDHFGWGSWEMVLLGSSWVGVAAP